MTKNRSLKGVMTGLIMTGLIMSGLTMTLLSLGCGTTMPRIRSREPDVKEHLKSLNYGLKSEAWGSVERFFSQDYEGGYQNLAPHMKNFWRNEDLVEIRFIVSDVVESDDLINSRVRWHKTYVDQAGILKNTSGTSDIIFKEIDKRLKIFAIHGEPFF